METPKRLRKKMENVAIVIEDEPTLEQLKKSGTTSERILLGLYEGIPRPQRGCSYTLVLPDKITIFQKPIEEIAGSSPELIKQQVKETIWHEIAHHFGFDEEAIKKLHLNRRTKKNYSTR